MVYGINSEKISPKTTRITVWSGPFASILEAVGEARDGAKSVTLRLEYSGTVKVKLPKGITFPRTSDNYEEIDWAIELAMAGK